MIVDRLELGPFAVNCYLVADETSKAGVVIDPGAEAAFILSRAEMLDMKIGLIVLTHAHMDHVGALREVKESTGVEIAIHIDDALSLRARPPFGGFGMAFPPAPSPNRLLKGGDNIEVGNLSFQVLHTPGHTPGGICLLGNGVVFTGDTLFNFGIGRTDFPGGSYDELMESIRTKLMVLPDDTVVYPGHGPQSTIGTERRRNPFLHGQV